MKARDSGVSAAKRAPNPKGKYMFVSLVSLAVLLLTGPSYTVSALYAGERAKAHIITAQQAEICESVTEKRYIGRTPGSLRESACRRQTDYSISNDIRGRRYCEYTVTKECGSS